MKKYSYLFKEGKIGSVTIPNRVIMPAMGTVMCSSDGEITYDQIAYYEERARGGTGLIVTEIIAVEPELGKATMIQTRADEERFVPMLSRLTEAVHKYETRIFAQLHHAGNQSNSQICNGKQIVAPSEVINQGVGEKPRALTLEEVKDLVGKFANAALLCQKAGFDGVELHGAHGYLINQFMSPHSNHRQDEYGGNFENRMRFVREIIQNTKELCGKDFPVMVRFSADEFVEGGITADGSKEIARFLQESGADALDVSCGTYETMPTLLEPITYEQGWRVYLAEAVKKEVDIPVIAVGVIRKPEFAEKVLEDGRADFVAMGRELLSEPEWVKKTAEGREDELRHCIQCLYCIERIFTPKTIGCAVNACTGREREFRNMVKDGNNRVVDIIGGGPAGIEAARILALRGFKPVLYEKREELGGQLIPGCKPPHKDDIEWYKDYLNRQMEKLDVEVRLGTIATPELVAKDNPYAVFVAVGADSFIPSSINGIQNDKVITAEKLLNEDVSIKKGQKAVVIGGGLTGCEVAEMLAKTGVKASLVEMLPQIAPGTHPINMISIQQELKKSGVDIKTQRKLLEVKEDHILVENTESGQSEKIPADWVILGLGLEKPADDKLLAWKESFDRVKVIGDAMAPRRVAQAVREGFDAAWVL